MNGVPYRKKIVIIKTPSFEGILFRKMLLALYNRAERTEAVYSYRSASCDDARRCADHVHFDEDLTAPLQFLADTEYIAVPEIDAGTASDIVRFNSRKNYIKILVEALKLGIPVAVTLNEAGFAGRTGKARNVLVEELGRICRIMTPDELAGHMGIKGYEKASLAEEVKKEEMKMTENAEINIAKYIDHTLLKPQASIEDIKKLCAEASKYSFKAVCVNPYHVKTCKQLLEGSGVLVATVIGFPLGANRPEIKAAETEKALADGADEFDMVLNIGEVKSGNFKNAEDDIRAVVEAAGGKTVKVILETCLLTDEEKIKACIISQRAGAHFVKTSTGFSTGGATIGDVYLMKQTVGDSMKVKASGGVKDYDTALKMIEKGAERIGTSSGINIVEKKGGSGEKY